MSDKNLNIAAVQYDIQWLDKAANFTKLESMLRDFFASHDGHIDLLLLPETFSTGFCLDDNSVKQPEDGGDDVYWLKKIASKYSCVVAGSVFVKQGDKKANRLYWVSPASDESDGSVEFYDKRHLFRLGNEGDYVVQGQSREIFEIKSIRILPQICYDLRFPVFQRNMFQRNRSDYDVMVNVANWPAVRRPIWDTLLKARAIENQAYVIGVNRVGNDGHKVAHSGGTCVIGFTGEELVTAQDDGSEVISFQLDLSALDQFKTDFPAYLDADDFNISL